LNINPSFPEVLILIPIIIIGYLIIRYVDKIKKKEEVKKIMKIVDRRIEVRAYDTFKNGEIRTLKKNWCLYYIIAFVSIIFAGILSLIVLGLPLLFNTEPELFVIPTVIVCLIPILILAITPKEKRYEIKIKEFEKFEKF